MRCSRLIGVVLIGCAGATLALGQSTRAPSYDVKSEVVVRGTVARVAAIPDWMGKNGVNVTLETPESVMIHVDTAPAEFLTMLDFAVVAGDELEVVGVWAQWDGERVLLTRTMTLRKVAVSVRDPAGKPVW